MLGHTKVISSRNSQKKSTSITPKEAHADIAALRARASMASDMAHTDVVPAILLPVGNETETET